MSKLELDFEPTELEIEHCIEMLVPKLQRKVNDHYDAIYKRGTHSAIVGKSYLSESKPPLLTKKKGRVYWKLILENRNDFGGSSSTVYGFVRRADGAVFRAADWKKPETRTKRAIRGYVTDEFPEDYFTAYGVVYDMES